MWKTSCSFFIGIRLVFVLLLCNDVHSSKVAWSRNRFVDQNWISRRRSVAIFLRRSRKSEWKDSRGIMRSIVWIWMQWMNRKLMEEALFIRISATFIRQIEFWFCFFFLCIFASRFYLQNAKHDKFDLKIKFHTFLLRWKTNRCFSRAHWILLIARFCVRLCFSFYRPIPFKRTHKHHKLCSRITVDT